MTYTVTFFNAPKTAPVQVLTFEDSNELRDILDEMTEEELENLEGLYARMSGWYNFRESILFLPEQKEFDVAIGNIDTLNIADVMDEDEFDDCVALARDGIVENLADAICYYGDNFVTEYDSDGGFGEYIYDNYYDEQLKKELCQSKLDNYINFKRLGRDALYDFTLCNGVVYNAV